MEAKEMKPGKTYVVKYRKHMGIQGPGITTKRIAVIQMYPSQIYGYKLDNHGQADGKDLFPIQGIKSIEEVRFAYEG